MGRPLPLTTLIVLAVFVAAGGIVWLAYGETGNLQGEPPLIQASATPLKRAPDDPGGRKVAELGGVGELMADPSDSPASEQLMPEPEQPLSPAEAAIVSLGQNGSSKTEGLEPDPAKREQATAALKQLVDELRSDGLRSNDGTTPSGAGGPVDRTDDLQPSPARPKILVGAENNGIAPRQSGAGNQGNANTTAGFQVASTGDAARADSVARFQGTPGGRFRIQLAAVREEDDARRAWSQFQQTLGAAIAGLEPFIERAETENGTFYRVQIGPFAESGNAASLCVELQRQDASCFVVSR